MDWRVFAPPPVSRGSIGVGCLAAVKDTGTGFRRNPGCVEDSGKLSAWRMGGGVENVLGGMRLFFVRSCVLAGLCDQGRLILGNIPVEGIEKAAPHQAAYYTITLSSDGLARAPHGDGADYGVRPRLVDTS